MCRLQGIAASKFHFEIRCLAVHQQIGLALQLWAVTLVSDQRARVFMKGGTISSQTAPANARCKENDSSAAEAEFVRRPAAPIRQPYEEELGFCWQHIGLCQVQEETHSSVIT